MLDEVTIAGKIICNHEKGIKLGYGCYGAGGAYNPAIEKGQLKIIIQAAWQRGIRFFDTAPFYGKTFGDNEGLLGEIFEELVTEGIVSFDELVLVTKCGLTPEGGRNSTKARIFLECVESRARLKLPPECPIDLYILHRWDEITPLSEVAEAMSVLIDKGEISSVGLSEMPPQHVQEFCDEMRKLGKEKYVQALESEESIINWVPAQQAFEVCKKNSLLFISYSSMARGLATSRSLSPTRTGASFYSEVGKYTGDHRSLFKLPQFDEENRVQNMRLVASLSDYAQNIGLTLAQLALAYLSNQQGVLPLVSTTKIEHLNENIEGCQRVLTESDSKAIADIQDKYPVQGSRNGPVLHGYSGGMQDLSPRSGLVQQRTFAR